MSAKYYTLSQAQQCIEITKDIVEEDDLPRGEHRLKIQANLSKIRQEVLLLEQRLKEAEIRQNVYAEVCEKVLDRAIREARDA